MVDELTREEVTQKLEQIFTAVLDGDDLEKQISSIPKRLDKFEGRWGGLIGWAEKKYEKLETDESEVTDEGNSEEEETAAESETQEKPAKKKSRGMFSKLGKSKKEVDPPLDTEEEGPQAEEKPAKKKRGGFFSKRGKSKEEDGTTGAADSDDSEEAVDEPTDEPEEATEGEPDQEEHDDSADLMGDEPPLEKAARLLEEGDSEGALVVWKGLIRSDGGNPEVWKGFASYFASAGRPGRAQACEEHADELP
jgi:hypothetical protein